MEPGEVVGERYRLDAILGVGGMGIVWSATHTITHKPVALKFLRAEKADPTLRQRFLREARAACAVRHPNVAEIHDVFETHDGTPVMVMELLEGETLASRLDRDKVLPLADVATIMMLVSSAVGTAHHLGIVHRDLKPDNIFLVRSGESSTVKILDFGIAKLTASDGIAAVTSELTTDGSMLGTPYYMSPEQADGERDVDHRSDVWSLGIILYECLSGVLPTEGENLGQVLKSITRGAFAPISDRVADLPDDIAALVGRMLARERLQRPQSLVDVCATLRGYTDEQPPTFGEPAAPGRASLTSASDSGSRPVLPGAATPHGVAVTPLRASPPGRTPAGGSGERRGTLVSPMALSLAGRETAVAQTLGASAQNLDAAKSRRSTRPWRSLLGGIAVVASLGVVAWLERGTSRSTEPRARPATSVVAPPATTPTETSPLPSSSPTTAATTDADASRAASSSPIHATPATPQAPRPRAPASSTAQPSATASAPARPGGVFAQPPF